MAQSGFITLHRKLLTSQVFGDSELLKVWIWCLLRANHQDVEAVHANQIIPIKRGQFITGRFTASEELSMSHAKYRKRMQILGGLGQIAIKSTNKYSVITVIKYSDYQDKEKKTTNKKPTKSQQKATDNNVNNENNISGEPQKDMGWKNKQSDNDDDLPTIDMDTREPERDLEDERKKKVTALIEWAEKVRGKKFLDTPTQRKFINDMRSANISPTEIKKTYSDLLVSEYWQGRDTLPDFKTVFSNIKNKV